ncbi:hypothetical protein [Streptomyces sp. NPDC044948]|uniref:hypothetical protein n=1 Tax=Streptomyces sp. NPDC044948 TaxID=3157092 RepID=UPI0033D8A04B
MSALVVQEEDDARHGIAVELRDTLAGLIASHGHLDAERGEQDAHTSAFDRNHPHRYSRELTSLPH